MISPDPRRGRRGLVVLGLRGPPLPGLLVPARQPEHRPPAPAPDRRHPGGGRPAVHHRPVVRQRRPGRGGPPHRRARPRRPGHGVLHQRRRRGDRERHAHGPPPHRPPQGPDHLPQLPRRHGGVHRRHRRPAAVAERALRRRHGQVLGAVPLPVALLLGHGGRGGRAGAPAPRRRPHGRGPADRRRGPARDRGRHERHPRAAPRLPAGRPGAVRPVRHRDDLRRGDGRLRPLRRVVRGRPLERHARPHLLRQGRQLGLRPPRGRGHQPGHRRHVQGAARTRAGSPTRATRWPARRPSPRSPSSRRRACSSTSARWGPR